MKFWLVLESFDRRDSAPYLPRAVVCDERAAWYWDEYNRTHRTVSEHYSDAAEECAAAIRALRDHGAAPSAKEET